MARSRRKAPITGITTAVSEAADKAAWHRRWRRGEKQRLNANPQAEPIGHHGYSSQWAMSKDGKCYWLEKQPKLMRK
ncbi:Phage protein (fragment) [Cupriavidus necator]|uniref:Phage protein n=1 Tax=Cupriavidus necator TaxID=106590 RepID=A0A1K0JX32_CUPNE